jgi:uncharacterized protein involved in type VI secretion and phage assembly
MQFGRIAARTEALAWAPPGTAGGIDGTLCTGTWTAPAEAGPQRFGLQPIAGALVEHRDAPVLGQDQGWPDMLARIRVEQAAAARAQLAARSNLEALFAGCAIRFDAGAAALGMVPRYDVNGFVVHRITHHVLAQGSELCRLGRRRPGDDRTLYWNRFRAVPAQVTGPGGATGFTYRPPRRARPPRVATLRHATVVSTVEEQVAPDLDDSGSYLVMPDFPLETVSGSGDPPKGLRMPRLAQFALPSLPTPGSGRLPAGLHMPLRPGQAVLVGFNAGDPDQPFIAGLLPDPSQPSPVTSSVAGQPKQSVLRTTSGLTVRITDHI